MEKQEKQRELTEEEKKAVKMIDDSLEDLRHGRVYEL